MAFPWTDDFNRADSSSLGAGWIGSGVGVTSNAARGTTTGGIVAWFGAANWDNVAYGPDYDVSATITRTTTAGTTVGIVARYYSLGGGDNYYLALVRQNATVTIELWKCVGGTLTQLGSSVPASWSDGADILKLRCQGNTISVLKNSTTVITQADSSHAEVCGTAGLRCGQASQGSWDNFLVDFVPGATNLVAYRTGAVADTWGKVWFLTSGAATVTVDYSTDSTLATGASTTAGVPTAPGGGFTGVARLTGLSPSTTYYYRINVGGVAKNLSPYPSFKTFPAAGTPVNFSHLYGSCNANTAGKAADDGNVFNAIPGLAPAFVAHLGDQIYADFDTPFASDDVADFRAKYRVALSPASRTYYWHKARRSSSWVGILDDHNIRNNFDGATVGWYANAIQAYEEFWGSANYDPYRPGVKYYSFQYGNVGFFVPDLRSYRSPNSATDNSSKTILGAQQKADLKAWLASDDAGLPIRVVLCSVGVSGFGSTGNDCWGGGVDTDLTTPRSGFTTERNEIWDFILANGIPGVVWAEADQHWSGAARVTRGGANFHCFLASPFNIAPLAPNPSTSPQFLFKYNAGNNLGRLSINTTVSPRTVKFDVLNSAGSIVTATRPSDGASVPATVTTDDSYATSTSINFGLPPVGSLAAFASTLAGASLSLAASAASVGPAAKAPFYHLFQSSYCGDL